MTLLKFVWLLNLEKSHLEPVQRLVYLGAHFDTIENTISLLVEKIPIIGDRVSLALTSSCLGASQCLNIIGTRVSTAPIVKWTLWRLRPLQTGLR